MIARIWHGMVPVSKSAAYLDLMQRIALPEYRATPGNRGAWCLRRADGDVTHFEMLTLLLCLPPQVAGGPPYRSKLIETVPHPNSAWAGFLMLILHRCGAT